MDLDTYLQSSSVRDQSYAAIVLRAEGADGAEHLHALLQKCQAIDQTKELDRFEESLLAFGAMTMGDMIGSIGFDAHDLLHTSIAKWLVRSTSSPNLAVAAGAICSLGNLAARAAEVTECLGKLVDADRRSTKTNTFRYGPLPCAICVGSTPAWQRNSLTPPPWKNMLAQLRTG